MEMSLVFMIFVIIALVSRVKKSSSRKNSSQNKASRDYTGYLASDLRKKFESGRGAVNAANQNKSYSNKWHTEKLPGSGLFQRPVRTSDGHQLSDEQDITCRQYGHNHSGVEEPGARYIVHDDPEDGFIILNGKKMRITEADKYENTI